MGLPEVTFTLRKADTPESSECNCKAPKIGDNGTWLVWDAGARSYVDTEIKAAGYTPVRGVDYWTGEDVQSMVDAVLAALPNGDEVSY